MFQLSVHYLGRIIEVITQYDNYSVITRVYLMGFGPWVSFAELILYNKGTKDFFRKAFVKGSFISCHCMQTTHFDRNHSDNQLNNHFKVQWLLGGICCFIFFRPTIYCKSSAG